MRTFAPKPGAAQPLTSTHAARAAATFSPSRPAPPVIHEALESQGQPLDSPVRERMEPRLGHDFTRVRVHTDANAAQSARMLNAAAYTIGEDVFFGTRQFQPGTGKGDRLIAHELVHTVQQGPAGPRMSGFQVSRPGDPAEVEAERIAGRAFAPGAPGGWQRPSSRLGMNVVSLQPAKETAEASADSAATVLKRTISISGGQVMTVHGTFPGVVETALADGWLSVREMSDLRLPGTHSGDYDGAGLDIMEMLTQRSLSFRGKSTSQIQGLSESERLTWEGVAGNGVRNLGPLDREGGAGVLMTRYTHYTSQMPAFEASTAEAESAGVTRQLFNVRRYLNDIDAEITLAPDDKASLRRLLLLRYVMQYPTSDSRSITGLPIPTTDQIAQYKKLKDKSEPNYRRLEEFALGLGVPDTL
jgi:hypothetical protein